MQRLKMLRKFARPALGLLFCCVASAAQSAVLIIEDGKLSGATGVIVDGNLYNVDFRDGTCFDLFSGCDEDSDFAINWLSEGLPGLAQAALYDQVFLGAYDTQPELTEGCTNTAVCQVYFPTQKLGPVDAVGFATTENAADADPDTTTGAGGGVFRFQDYGLLDYRTYAVWDGPFSAPAAVPALSPSMALALCSSLLGVGGFALRRLS